MTHCHQQSSFISPDYFADFKSSWGVTDANVIVLFKDSLSVVGGQCSGHMTSCGFVNRHKRHTIASNGTRNEGKFVFDSPEMLRALELHSFADLKAALFRCARFLLFIPFNIPRNFHLGTTALKILVTDRVHDLACRSYKSAQHRGRLAPTPVPW